MLEHSIYPSPSKPATSPLCSPYYRYSSELSSSFCILSFLVIAISIDQTFYSATHYLAAVWLDSRHGPNITKIFLYCTVYIHLSFLHSPPTLHTHLPTQLNIRANEEEISFVPDTASMTIQKLRKAKNKSSIQEILDSIESSSSTYQHVDVFSYFELLPSFQHVTCQQSSSFDNMQHIRRLVSPQLFIQLLLHFALAASDFLQQFICTKSVTSELILRAVLQCTATLTMTFLMMNAFN